MGLIKCRECGNPVSTKAPLCPTCGAPAKKRMGCVTVVLGCTIGFVILGIILPAIRGDSSTKPTSSRSASNNIDPIVAASVPLPPVIPKPPAFDIRKISPAEMPKRAVLTLEQSFPIANGKGSAKAMPGAEVAILALDGELVEAAYLDGKAKIPYRNTNIEDQITKARLDEWRRKISWQRKNIKSVLGLPKLKNSWQMSELRGQNSSKHNSVVGMAHTSI